jgi:hypothetical protein
MVRSEHNLRKSLRDAGIIKIIGEGISHDSKRITVEHYKGDKKRQKANHH